MEMTRRVMTNVAEAPGASRPDGTVCQCYASTPTAAFKDVAGPERRHALFARPGSICPRSPAILQLPDQAERYYLMPMLSGWTDVLPSSRQASGHRGPATRPKSTPLTARAGRGGALPDGVKELKSAYEHGLDSGPDLLHRHAGGLQGGARTARQIRAGSAQHSRQTVHAAHGVRRSNKIDMKTPVPASRSSGMDTVSFFKLLGRADEEQIRRIAADAPIVARLATHWPRSRAGLGSVKSSSPVPNLQDVPKLGVERIAAHYPASWGRCERLGCPSDQPGFTAPTTFSGP